MGDYKLTEEQRQRRRAWYDAWIARIKKGAFDGNRHYCIGVLFNYAMKAEIPLDDAYQDALELLPWLNSLTKKEGNEFTENDILDAVRYYDRKYIKMGRDGIQRLTKIDIGQTGPFRMSMTQMAHGETKTADPQSKRKLNPGSLRILVAPNTAAPRKQVLTPKPYGNGGKDNIWNRNF